MQIKRDAHKSKYTCISNGIFTDNRLSLAARALMGAVLSLPDSWEFSVNGIAALLGINSSTALKYLHELENLGYLKTMRKKENGRYTTKQFCFIEVPANENSINENSTNENSINENTVTVNSPQLNNNIQNTKKQNTNFINQGERRAAITSNEFELLRAEFGAELAHNALDTLNDYLNAKSRTINGVVVDSAELVNILCQTNTEDIRKALKAVQAKRPASFAAYFGTVLFNLVKQKAAGASGDYGGAGGYSSGGDYGGSGDYGSWGNYGGSGGNYGSGETEDIPISRGSMHPSSIDFNGIMQEIYGKYRE